MRSFPSFAVVFLALTLLLACHGKPSAPKAGDPAAGQKVFQSACAVCHNTTQAKKVGPGLQGLYHMQQLPDGEPVNDAAVERWVRNGGGNMPGFKNILTPDQMRDLLAYLKTL